MMRITGGQAKGRPLACLKGLLIRPSTDQVRQAIFNIIGQDLTGVKVLDLFAGTGSLGLEALSRGAVRVVFIDKARQSIDLIKKNLARCAYSSKGMILKRDLRKGLPFGHPSFEGGFDLVFLDPPYGKGLLSPLLEALPTGKILLPHSRVVAESSKTESLPLSFGDLQMADERTYGDTKINFYVYEVMQ